MSGNLKAIAIRPSGSPSLPRAAGAKTFNQDRPSRRRPETHYGFDHSTTRRHEVGDMIEPIRMPFLLATMADRR